MKKTGGRRAARLYSILDSGVNQNLKPTPMLKPSQTTSSVSICMNPSCTSSGNRLVPTAVIPTPVRAASSRNALTSAAASTDFYTIRGRKVSPDRVAAGTLGSMVVRRTTMPGGTAKAQMMHIGR